MDKIKWIPLQLLILTIGLLEYLPIKNLPDSIITIIQETSFYLPIISIILLVILYFKTEASKLNFLLIPILLYIQFFPISLRHQLNNYIISKNDGKPIHLVENVVAGTKMEKRANSVIFSWNLNDIKFEDLIYEQNHNQQNITDREIITVINSNWYVQKSDFWD